MWHECPNLLIKLCFLPKVYKPHTFSKMADILDFGPFCDHENLGTIVLIQWIAGCGCLDSKMKIFSSKCGFLKKMRNNDHRRQSWILKIQIFSK